jgi:hypothetical protein
MSIFARIVFSLALVAAALSFGGCQSIQTITKIEVSTELGWDRYFLFTILCEKDECANSSVNQFHGPYNSATECEDAGNFILSRTLVILSERDTLPDTMRVICMPVAGENKSKKQSF